MVEMQCLNEPELLYNLNLRFKNKKIYTSVGNTLISINPFTNIDDLYGQA